MTVVLVAAAGALAAAAGSEVALRCRKLQTALASILAIWIALFAAAAVWLRRATPDALVPSAIFWVGASLLWFGVRSHAESSILLRMLCLLRARPMRDGEILDEYASIYGESMRLAELRRGGFVANEGERPRVTPKGKAVLLVVSKLR